MNNLKIDQYYRTVSYNRKPEQLSIEEWQIALRRQYAELHSFSIHNLGTQTVFSDYKVRNPESKNAYKVAIRDGDYLMDFCECMDFKTNSLGTCKHIEAVLLKLKNENLLDRAKDSSYKSPYTSVYLKYFGSRDVQIRIGSEHEDDFKKLSSQYFDTNGVLMPIAYYNFENFLDEAYKLDNTFRCYPDALEYIIEMRERRKRIQMVDEKYRKDLDDGPLDKLVKTKLFQYQKEGVCFAASVGRCLIADDMGLGKTVQALAATELLRKEMGISRVVIVCPTSLKYQWKNEIEKFTSNEALVLEGAQHKRVLQYHADTFYKIVSYHTVASDLDFINQLEPDLVILDEAQRIKNFKSKVSNNVKKIKSTYALVLTGTPLENKLEDLYSIMQFVQPYALGPFYKFIAEHQIKNEIGKVIGYKELNEISILLSDVMLRRKKSEVIDQLPERMDKNLFVPMTEKQKEMHDGYQTEVAKLISKWHRFGYLNEKERQRLMIHLNQMRMVCDSSFIVDQETRHDTKIDELMNLLNEFFAQGNSKAVVFSQWERMTRLVAAELQKRNIKFEYLHGGIPSFDRKDLFNNFSNESDCKVFLSTDAGGVGLNLQSASLLINLDIPWNPAVLEQRIGRIYRLGQKKNVNIINLVSAGTIEHRMLDVLKFKSLLSEGVLDNGEDTIFMGESKFKQFMNSVEQMVGQSAIGTAPEVISEEEMENIEPDVSTAITIEEQEKIAELLNIEMTEQSRIEDDEKTEDNLLQEQVPAFSTSEISNLGTQLLSELSKTLSNKETAQKLINSLLSKDEITGQTYLKIPVENEQVVENILKFFAGLVKQ